MNKLLSICAILNSVIFYGTISLGFAEEIHFPEPSLDEERLEVKKATDRYRLLEDENRTMLENDRLMIKYDDDPNEGLGGFPSSELNRPYPNQEKQMQGDSLKSHRRST